MEHFAVAGDGAVGKTSLIINLVGSSWEEVMVQPAYESYNCDLTLHGEMVQVCFHDTAGQDDFAPARDLIFAKATTVLLCYSIISPPSFDNITEKWLPDVQQNNPSCNIILVATKTDLHDQPEVLERLSQRGYNPVTTKQGKALAKTINASFIEVDRNTTSIQFSKLLSTSSNSKKKKKGNGRCVIA